jgi:hypothetical protein
VRFALSVLASPFAPKVANAADGVGSLFGDLTHASLVYRKRPLTVSPASATVMTGASTVMTGASQTFTATGPRPGPFTWSVNGIDVLSGVAMAYGKLTIAENGLSAVYTAPGAVPTLATFDVCIQRSVARADKGCGSVTVQLPPVPFTAVVLGDFNVFDDNAAASSYNQQFYRNFATFVNAGPRASQTKVVFYEGHGSPMPTQRATFPYYTMGGVSAALGLVGYSLEISETTSLVSVPSDVKALFVFVPTQSFTVAEATGLRAFVAEGGRLVIVSDNSSFYSSHESSNAALNDLLYKLGSGTSDAGTSIECGYVPLPQASLRLNQLTLDATGALLGGLTVACTTRFAPAGGDIGFLYDSGNQLLLGAVTNLSAVAPSGALIAARPMLRSMAASPTIARTVNGTLIDPAIGGSVLGSIAPASRSGSTLLKP